MRVSTKILIEFIIRVFLIIVGLILIIGVAINYHRVAEWGGVAKWGIIIFVILGALFILCIEVVKLYKKFMKERIYVPHQTKNPLRLRRNL